MTFEGLQCGHGHHHDGRLTADGDDHITRDDAATQNVTDLRRARQRARSVVRDVLQAVLEYMGANDVAAMLEDDARGARRVNRAVTEIASRQFQNNLVAWLEDRNRTTMARASREAFQQMRGVVDAPDSSFRDDQDFPNRDQELIRQVRMVDAGLLYDTELADDLGLNEPLAEELGNDITRQLRQGVEQGETVSGGLRDRVEMVITDGDHPERQEKGVTGQTKRSKAELIAHDSVQDAYNTAARARYLENGFRYGVFDATIDHKTTELCRRMNEYVIDLRDSPYLVPGLHPYCRSGIRPVLDISDKTVVRREDIADGYLQTIMSTKSYRPPADLDNFQPTPVSREYGHTDG